MNKIDDQVAKILIDEAIKVRENAYAPYSGFKVGAAILTEKGRVYTGCNVENASFGGTICAERGAAMTAIATEGKTKFKAIAVVTDAKELTPPCAICRQFLAEFSDDDMQVYMYSVTTKASKCLDFGTILPYAFRSFEESK